MYTTVFSFPLLFPEEGSHYTISVDLGCDPLASLVLRGQTCILSRFPQFWSCPSGVFQRMGLVSAGIQNPRYVKKNQSWNMPLAPVSFSFTFLLADLMRTETLDKTQLLQGWQMLGKLHKFTWGHKVFSIHKTLCLSQRQGASYICNLKSFSNILTLYVIQQS